MNGSDDEAQAVQLEIDILSKAEALRNTKCGANHVILGAWEFKLWRKYLATAGRTAYSKRHTMWEGLQVHNTTEYSLVLVAP